MRTWDNYFWWFEGRKFPPSGMVDPVNWPPERGVRPLSDHGQSDWPPTGCRSSTGDIKATVWLSPELVDFNAECRSRSTASRSTSGGVIVEPDLSVLLEDVRTRGDRLHPFWAKVEQ